MYIILHNTFKGHAPSYTEQTIVPNSRNRHYGNKAVQHKDVMTSLYSAYKDSVEICL